MRRLIAALYLTAIPAYADDVPRVVVDIAPIHALVAQVMDGVGTPDQIIPNGASPHGYAMRPSEARALGRADVVVWVGPSLTNWLEDPIETLAPNAMHLTLMTHAGTKTLPMRSPEMLNAAAGEGHDDHADHDDHGHDEKHDDHADHDDNGHDEKHDDHADHDGHGDDEKHDDHETAEKHDDHEDHDTHEAQADAHDHGHGHDHGSIDPHGWLSPANAVLWSGVVAQQLAKIDPANAQTYMGNWEALSAQINDVSKDIAAQMVPYSETPFVVLHDAFQYFDATFGIEAAAFIIPGSGQTPGPARVKALRDHLAENPAVCAFTAPQENEDLLRTALEGQQTRVAVLDPLSAGDGTYPALLRAFADSMLGCFEGKS